MCGRARRTRDRRCPFLTRSWCRRRRRSTTPSSLARRTASSAARGEDFHQIQKQQFGQVTRRRCPVTSAVSVGMVASRPLQLWECCGLPRLTKAAVADKTSRSSASPAWVSLVKALLAPKTLEVPAIAGCDQPKGCEPPRDSRASWCLSPASRGRSRAETLRRRHERLILEQRDWVKEHRDYVVMRTATPQQDSDKVEEMGVPCMRQVVPLAVVLAVRSVGLVCPPHEVHGKGNNPGRQFPHRQTDQMAGQRPRSVRPRS